MKKITMEMYLQDPESYELRKGHEEGAPACPYGKERNWVGYDKIEKEYVRFVKSVFKKLVQEKQ